jgi:hypothetical protein
MDGLLFSFLSSPLPPQLCETATFITVLIFFSFLSYLKTILFVFEKKIILSFLELMKRQNILLIFNNLEKENKNLDYNNP